MLTGINAIDGTLSWLGLNHRPPKLKIEKYSHFKPGIYAVEDPELKASLDRAAKIAFAELQEQIKGDDPSSLPTTVATTGPTVMIASTAIAEVVKETHKVAQKVIGIAVESSLVPTFPVVPSIAPPPVVPLITPPPVIQSIAPPPVVPLIAPPPVIQSIAPPQISTSLASSFPVPIPNPAASIPDISVLKNAKTTSQMATDAFTHAAAIASQTLKRIKPFWAFPPVLLWMLYTSKERFSTDITVCITAKPVRTGYEITLGKGDAGVSIAFEVVAGQPIRFLYEEGAEMAAPSEATSLYQSVNSNVLSLNEASLIRSFVWKRKERHLVLNIVINDLEENSSLEKGSKDYPPIVIADKEFIHVTHRQSNHTDNSKISEPSIGIEKWNSIRTIYVDVDSSSSNLTQNIQIPSADGQKTNEYLKITALQLPF